MNFIAKFSGILILIGCQSSCFFTPEIKETYEEAWLREVTDAQADMVKEYFETRGIPKNLSPKIKIVTTYKRIIETSLTVRKRISGKSLEFPISYQLTAFILKPDPEFSYGEKIQQLLPFFKQNRLATLCSYEVYLRADPGHSGQLHLYGIPLNSQYSLRGFTSVILTSDLIWITDPEDPENHFNSCKQNFNGPLKVLALKSMKESLHNSMLIEEGQVCDAPDPRQRMSDHLERNEGDSSCKQWFQSLSFKGKDGAVPRCLKLSETSGHKGYCSLRAKNKSGVALFRLPEGGLTVSAFHPETILASDPNQTLFLCDETIGAKADIMNPGSWFQYASAHCFNHDLETIESP